MAGKSSAISLFNFYHSSFPFLLLTSRILPSFSMPLSNSPSLPSKTPFSLLRLFFEFFKIALFVVGGGHAIIIVADEVFGRKLRWTREGELLDHLPIFQMIPGLIAGNTAIYVGLKTAGRLGAAIALSAVALPSLLIFLIVSCGYSIIPLHNPWVESAFLGLRASLTGVVLGTILRSWLKSVNGIYGYLCVSFASFALIFLHVNTVAVLLIAMSAGIFIEFTSHSLKTNSLNDSAGISLPPLSRTARIRITCATIAFASIILSFGFAHIYLLFVKFGLLCFGGGFVLIPLYINEFVGVNAPYLNLPSEDFSNLMALTQMTPGPVSVNAATFFGHRLAGIPGAIIATLGLLSPGFFLLTKALSGLERWKNNPLVRGLLFGVKPATIALMISACFTFCKMSIVSPTESNLNFSPLALFLALFSAFAIVSKKMSVMSAIFSCAAIGLLSHLLP